MSLQLIFHYYYQERISAGVKIDLTHDTATSFGKIIRHNVTCSGHQCVPLNKTTGITDVEDFPMKNEPNMEDLASRL